MFNFVIKSLFNKTIKQTLITIKTTYCNLTALHTAF